MSGRRKGDKPPPRSSTPGPSGKKTILNPFAPGGIFRPKTPKPESNQPTSNDATHPHTPVSTASTSRGTHNGPPLPPTRPPSAPPAVHGAPARPRRQSEHGGGTHGRSGNHHSSGYTRPPPVPVLPEHLRSPVQGRNTSAPRSGITGSRQHPRSSSTNLPPSPVHTWPPVASRAGGTEQTQAGGSGTQPRGRANTLSTTHGARSIQQSSQSGGSSAPGGASTRIGSGESNSRPSQPQSPPADLKEVHLFPGQRPGTPIYQLYGARVWKYSPERYNSVKRFAIQEYHRILELPPSHGLQTRIFFLSHLTLAHSRLSMELIDRLVHAVDLRVLALDHCVVLSHLHTSSWQQYQHVFRRRTNSQLQSLRLFDVVFETPETGRFDPVKWGLANLLRLLRRFCGQEMKDFDFSAPKLRISDQHSPSIETPDGELSEVLHLCLPQSLGRLRIRYQTQHTRTWLSMLLEHLPLLRVLMLEDQGNLIFQELNLHANSLPQLTHFVGNLSNMRDLMFLRNLRAICLQMSAEDDSQGLATDRKAFVDRAFRSLPELGTVIFYASQWDRTTTVLDALPEIDPDVQWRFSNPYMQGFDMRLWDELLNPPPQDVPAWSRFARTITSVSPREVQNYFNETRDLVEITHRVIERCGTFILDQEDWVFDAMTNRQQALEDPCASQIWGDRALNIAGDPQYFRETGITDPAYL